MEQDTRKTELDNAAAEQLLRDIISVVEIAKCAVTGKTEEQKAESYRFALDNIRELLGCAAPDETQAMITRDAVQVAANQTRRVVSLPDLYAERRERFGHVFGVWVRREDDGFAGTIYRDNVRILDVHTPLGKVKCVCMVKGALYEYIRIQEREIRRAVRTCALSLPIPEQA